MDSELFKGLLNKPWDRKGQWEVHQAHTGRLLAIGRCTDLVEVVVETGILEADGFIICIQSWALARGAYPNPRKIGLHITFAGLPLILCDEDGISLLAKNFRLL